MRKLIICIAFLAGLSLGGALSPAYGQGESDRLTAEEKKAANEIADRFITRLDETGDIEPLIKEMFVDDFPTHYAREQLPHTTDSDTWTIRSRMLPGLEVDPAGLSEVRTDEWRQYYVSAFNFMNYGFFVPFNRSAKTYLSGKEPDESLLDDMYPSPVIKLLEGNAMLRNVYKRTITPSKHISTPDDLRSVNKTLAEIGKILAVKDPKRPVKMSPDAIKVLAKSKPMLSEEFGYPMLGLDDTGHFGLPADTRFIVTFATPAHMLLIAKVGSDYKIVFACIGSPD